CSTFSVYTVTVTLLLYIHSQHDSLTIFEAPEVRNLANAIEESMANDRLRADHFIHLRCEVSASDCLEWFALFEDDPRVKLVSLIDRKSTRLNSSHVKTSYAVVCSTKNTT